MKRPIIVSTLVLALLASLGPGWVQPAEAGSWRIGSAFRVGGVHFNVAYGSHHRHHYRAPYYYRTSHRLRYDGYRCGSACFKSSGHYYHHPSCGLVAHHFKRYDYRSPYAYGGGYRGDYGGGHYGHRDYGYRGRGHGDYYGSHRHHDPRYCPYR